MAVVGQPALQADAAAARRFHILPQNLQTHGDGTIMCKQTVLVDICLRPRIVKLYKSTMHCFVSIKHIKFAYRDE